MLVVLLKLARKVEDCEVAQKLYMYFEKVLVNFITTKKQSQNKKQQSQPQPQQQQLVNKNFYTISLF